MTSYVSPKKNAEYIMYLGLPSQADPTIFKANPTIAAGDFKVSTDGGALGNLGTLPTVTPAAGKMVKVTLSASEMNGDNVTLVASDAAGAEWCDVIVNIQTSARQIDDLAYPTTSGRSIDVTATGAVGIDWGNIENPTTAVNLSGTNIDTDQVVASVTGAVGSVTGAVGSVTGLTVGNLDVAVSTRLASASYTAPLDAAGTRTAIGLASANLDTQLTAIDDYLDTEVATILAAVDTEVAAIKAKTDNLPAAPAATGDIPSAAAIADAVWDEAIAGHAAAGSTGEALSSAGSAGDPWATALPGAYGAGTAGKIIGDNLNATVSSRASQTSLDTLDDLVDTEVAAIKAKTDSLTFTVAGKVDANIEAVNAQNITGTGTTNDPWGPA